MSLVGTVAARPIFRRLGVTVPTIIGNVLGAVGPILCLVVANMEPTESTLVVYLVLVFLIYPIAIFNISANGLILDRVTPYMDRGMVQGINVAGCNFCWAFSGFLLGIYADATGVSTMIITVSGIALMGGILKIPLLFREEFKHNKVSSETSEKSSHSDTGDFSSPGDDKDEIEALGAKLPSVKEEVPTRTTVLMKGLSIHLSDEEASGTEGDDFIPVFNGEVPTMDGDYSVP